MSPIYPLSILLVDDEEATARSLEQIILDLGHRVKLAKNGEDALEILPGANIELLITDLIMPGMDGFSLVKNAKSKFPNLIVIMITGHDSFDLARKAQNLGADSFLVKPINTDQLDIAINQAMDKIQLKKKITTLGKLVEDKFGISNIIGSSRPMHEIFRRIELAKNSTANVLITGESGTGKELVARAIYSPQASRNQSFITVNCCAISEGLIESELFGHVRGAFSGAISDRRGLFEVANGGTIFLDEIGDIPSSIQTKLLRVLQDGEVRRVGDNKIRNVNVRVIAATNKNLSEAVKLGTFREDLFFRLNVVPIELPPLRDRIQDLPILVEHFLNKHNANNSRKTFNEDAFRLLQTYHYPGNIRELENIILRAISFSHGNIIKKPEIEEFLQLESGEIKEIKIPDFKSLTYKDFKIKLEELEKEFLYNSLEAATGNVAKAANAINITRTAFHNKIKRLGIQLENLR